ncbi:MAG: hypothetical protein KGL39_29515, partial [Patescibacteria group bacterium]|nr:hypothetical protein [Patescibacteria group bacterium]
PDKVHLIYNLFMESMEKAGAIPKENLKPSSGGGDLTDEERQAQSLGLTEPRPQNADLSTWTGEFPETQE